MIIFLLNNLFWSTCVGLVADSNPDSLKTKKSELRLYCDLLMQQVHMVKTAASNENGPDLKVCHEYKHCFRCKTMNILQ